MITDAPPSGARAKKQFDASDALVSLPLPAAGAFQTASQALADALATAEIAGERHSWAGRPQAEGDFDCHVQIRAHAEPVPARAALAQGRITVVPQVPFDGVAPGQTAVLYDGTRVIGQFTIDSTVSAVPVPA